MQTIYIPRDLYTERHDDEGRQHFGYAAVHYAAEKWAASEPDRSFRSTNVDDPGEGPVAFAWIGERDGLELTSAAPSADADGCYPDEDLPFSIAALPFAVGDYITRESGGGTVWGITAITDYGYDLVNVRTGGEGSLPFDTSSYVLTNAPTVTYKVTVRADHTADDVRDMLGNLGGGVTVSLA